jgi:hypothetical protein
MNFGFNSNVRMGDLTYHVQTEDRGSSHPFFDTVVYLAGRVVFKRSTSYEKFASETGAAVLAEKLHERLAKQHREVMSALEAGKLPFQVNEKAPPPAQNAEPRDGLDLRLVNPKTWLAGGDAVLEIELSDKNSKQRIGNADVEACLEHEKHRIPCAEVRTDAAGCATLRFPMPAHTAEGSCLVLRASDGGRFTELRFRLKSKPRDNAPVPVSR